MATSSIPAKQSREENTTTVPNWLELPIEITSNILQRLGTIEIVTNACQVCPLWGNICKDPLMWQTIIMTNKRFSNYDLVKICRNAVDRSRGHLDEINIEYFATDDLLGYIVDCTSNLRRLRLAKCQMISDEQLIKAAKKLRCLEELDISFSSLRSDSLEVIGQCCPLLKSLKYSMLYFLDYECDDEAFAIAKTMPGLRHLNIFGNQLTDDGLLAILDGCLLLEYLYLGGCHNLTGSLEKRCHEQIKDLRLDRDYHDETYETVAMCELTNDPSENLVWYDVPVGGQFYLDYYTFELFKIVDD